MGMSAATDTAGNIVWKENYHPFGERINNQAESFSNRQWFHGKAADEDTGLQYFGARYYDPVLGRFMGVDPVGFQEDNIHSFNKYAYGNNNPYKYIDPDGRIPVLVYALYVASVRGSIWLAQRQAGAIMAAEIGAGVATGTAMGGVSAAEGLAIRAASVNASAALASKLSALEKVESKAVNIRNLPDGRIRFYEAEVAATKPGPTRGAARVTEFNPSNGSSRAWHESYDHAGNVNRVHPKDINGQTVKSQHYPPTSKELGQ
jgi:RHS repeat-associated protein